jgi:hypothetical protein
MDEDRMAEIRPDMDEVTQRFALLRDLSDRFGFDLDGVLNQLAERGLPAWPCEVDWSSAPTAGYAVARYHLAERLEGALAALLDVARQFDRNLAEVGNPQVRHDSRSSESVNVNSTKHRPMDTLTGPAEPISISCIKAMTDREVIEATFFMVCASAKKITGCEPMYMPYNGSEFPDIIHGAEGRVAWIEPSFQNTDSGSQRESPRKRGHVPG